MNNNQPTETLERCQLDAGGFTTTLDSVYDWAKSVIADINAQFGDAQLSTRVSMFRQFGHEFVNLSIWDAQEKNRHAICFQLGAPHNYHLTRNKVPDATEAMHMIGIITSAINSKSFIGNQENEFNKYCAPDEWSLGQTNSRLYIR